jgi:DNA polymerase-3 subunit delta
LEIKDLDKQIKDGSLGSLYFFCGEEQFLMENKIRSIRKALLEPDFADLNFVCLEEKKISISQIYDELMSVPVMSDKKIVVIKNSGLFNNAKLSDYKTLCELISDIPDYMCVIFTEREFDEKKSKNLEPFKAHGQIVNFDPLSPVQLERWLDKLFSDKGKRVLPRDINTIIRMCGQNMALLFNEYNKLLMDNLLREILITAGQKRSDTAKSDRTLRKLLLFMQENYFLDINISPQHIQNLPKNKFISKFPQASL